MNETNDAFFHATLRHFSTLRQAGIGPSRNKTPFPDGWFDLPQNLWADFGAMFYLTALTGFHRSRTLAKVLAMLEPPLRLGQYKMFRSVNQQPRAFITWAGLSRDAERWFAVNHMPLRPEDWNSGPSKWLINFVAPFGHIEQIVPALTANPNETCVRTLWHNRAGDRYRIVQWSRAPGETKVDVSSFGVGQFSRMILEE